MIKKKDNIEQVATVEQPAGGINEATIEQQTDTNNEPTDFSTAQPSVPEPETDKQSDVSNDAWISIVIPFFAKKNQADEVLLAIRSCNRYLHENIRFVVIGDPIGAVNDYPVDCIEYKDGTGDQSDLLEVLKLAVVSELVSDKFILMEPGSYLIDDVNFCHIELPKHLGLANPNRYSGEEAVLINDTVHLLHEFRVPAYDYNTHCPVVIEKNKLIDLLSECTQILSGRYHVIFLYNNVYAVHPIRLDFPTDGWILPVVSQKPDPKTVERFITGKCFLYLKHFQENVKFLNPFLNTKK